MGDGICVAAPSIRLPAKYVLGSAVKSPLPSPRETETMVVRSGV